MIWEQLTPDDFRKAVKSSGGVCAVPVGVMERHGPHMPIGTDILMASKVTRLAAEIADVMVFPDFYFGMMSGGQPYEGNVNISAPTTFALLDEICDNIWRNGFRKIVLVSGHGGNPFLLRYYIQNSMYQKHDYVVSTFNAYPDIRSVYRELKDGKRRELYPWLTDEDVAAISRYTENLNKYYDHAELSECSWLMAGYPGLAKPELAGTEDGSNRNRMMDMTENDIYAALWWYSCFPNSYAGSAVGSNESIGRAILDNSVREAARKLKIVKDNADMLPVLEEWKKRW